MAEAQTNLSADAALAAPLSAPPVPTSMADKANSASSAAQSETHVAPGATNEALQPQSQPMFHFEEPPPSALFSTDLGRRPPRPVKSPGGKNPAPIARGSPPIPAEVAHFAHQWYVKYPRAYSYYFPESGHVIGDLFDEHDIYVFGESFLEEVLTFITRENVHRACTLAGQWQRDHPQRIATIAAFPHDPKARFAIVRKICNDNEIEKLPEMFLWHVANIIRSCINNVLREYQPSQSQVTAPGVATTIKGTDSGTGQLDVQPKQVVNQKLAAPGHGRSELAVDSGPPHRWADMPHQMQMQPMAQLPMGHDPHFGRQFGQHEGGPGHMQPQQMRVPPVRNNRDRTSSMGQRQNSGQYMQYGGGMHAGENMPMRPPGPQSRHPSGAMPAMHSPRLHGSMPVQLNQHMAGGINPMGNFGQFHQSPVPSPMLTNAMPYSPMVHAQHQTGPPYGAPPMVPGHQGHPGNAMGQRGSSIGDMTNGGQYPFNHNMQRNDPNVNGYRRDIRGDRAPALFDPYAGARPEFANSAPRRGSRSTSANMQGRGRKTSFEAHRSNLGPGITETPYVQNPHQQHQPQAAHQAAHQQASVAVAADPDFGCSEDWIGPLNEHVMELKMFDIPHAATKPDIDQYFVKNAGVHPQNVIIKTDAKGKLFTNIRFYSVDDARKGLAMNRSYELLGKHVSIKVPYYYYQPSQKSFTGARNVSQAPLGNRHMPSAQLVPKMPAAAPTKPAYSPQDARSDLLAQLQSESQPGPPTTMGSPETRKPKKQNKSPPKKAKKASETVSKQDTADSETDKVPAGIDSGEAAISISSPSETVVAGDLNVSHEHTKSAEEKDDRSATKVLPEKLVSAEEHEVASLTKLVKHLETDAQEKKGMQDPNKAKVEKESNKDEQKEDEHSPPPTIAEPEIASQPQTPVAQGKVIASPQECLLHSQQESNATKRTKEAVEPSETSQADVVNEPVTEQDLPPEGSVTGKGAESADDPLSRDEAGSDDEQKNDSSFHSAKEAQSDENEPKEDMGDKVLAPTTVPTPDDVTSEVPVDIGKDDSNKSMSEVSKTEAQQLEPAPAPAPPTTSSPAEKKPSEQQSGSLFPFLSRAQTKALKKKEKEAKKKEKKKAKTENAHPSTKGGPSSKVSEGGKSDSEVATSPSPKATSLVPGSGQKLALDEKSAPTHAADPAKQEAEPVIGEEVGHGGGKDSNPSADPLGSSQQNVPSESPIEMPKQDVQKPAGTSEVAYASEHVADNATADATAAPGNQSNGIKEEPGQIKSHVAMSKKVAVPKLNLPPRNPVTQSKVSTNGSSPDTVVPSTGGKLARSDTTDAPNEEAKLSQEDKDVREDPKMGDPSVPQATDHHGPLSPTDDFHTPAQTPGALAPQAPEQPKKPKNKRKKKKAAPKPSSESDAFSEQMKQVDALKPNLGGTPISYFRKIDDHVAEDGDKAAQGPQANKQSHEKNIALYIKERNATWGNSVGQDYENDPPRTYTAEDIDFILERNHVKTPPPEMDEENNTGGRS